MNVYNYVLNNLNNYPTNLMFLENDYNYFLNNLI